MVSEKAEMQARVFRAAKVASLGTLAAGFAHELNNPLTAVLGFAQRIQEVGAEEPILRYGEIIERAAQRMSKVVNQLGEYCREPNLAQEQPADLNRAVTAVMELFGPVIRRQNIEMEMDLDPELPRLLADPGHLMSLVQNLVTNARDALLELKGEADRRIAIRTWSEPRWVWISVVDSGLGMPEDVRDKAFDPFYTTKEVGKGTGLGLYVVHRIVDQYNGSIAIHTDKGQGTRIELQFPALTVQEA